MKWNRTTAGLLPLRNIFVSGDGLYSFDRGDYAFTGFNFNFFSFSLFFFFFFLNFEFSGWQRTAGTALALRMND